jgi:dTDP-glucose pyrophosphorylase
MQNQRSDGWQKTLVKPDATIQDVIRNLDESQLQIALVVTDAHVLLGTVTDGDVRRALLRGLDLQTNVGEIMFRSPMVVPPEMSRDMVMHLMRANRMHQLPVVDDRRKVIGIHLVDEVLMPAERPNQFVVMAGGFGKRLRPFTEDLPKPMLPVAGKPMLQHILERAIRNGFSRFYFSVHYLGNVIEDYFGDGSKWGVRIAYLREETPLGTAGALTNLSPPDVPFVVTNGDVLTDIHYNDMLDFHLQHKADATMAVKRHEWQNPYGVVKTEGLVITGFEEKPLHRSHVNAGIYVLDPVALEYIKAGESCDMPTLFERMGERGRRTIAFPMHEPWMDVGRPEDLASANGGTAAPIINPRTQYPA